MFHQGMCRSLMMSHSTGEAAALGIIFPGSSSILVCDYEQYPSNSRPSQPAGCKSSKGCSGDTLSRPTTRNDLQEELHSRDHSQHDSSMLQESNLSSQAGIFDPEHPPPATRWSAPVYDQPASAPNQRLLSRDQCTRLHRKYRD